jgi:hypothetical protein
MLFPAFGAVSPIISLRNRSMLNESDDEYPTPSSLTKPEGKSAARGDDVDSERMGSSAPAWGVSRTFLLFVSRSIIPHLSDTSKGRICAPL